MWMQSWQMLLTSSTIDFWHLLPIIDNWTDITRQAFIVFEDSSKLIFRLCHSSFDFRDFHYKRVVTGRIQLTGWMHSFASSCNWFRTLQFIFLLKKSSLEAISCDIFSWNIVSSLIFAWVELQRWYNMTIDSDCAQGIVSLATSGIFLRR